jgi:hypothetical protein
MIGYPNALWDKVNGIPFFKKRMTATHPYINYNGREEFVMNMSVYPGSSGSPVFLLTNEFYEKSRTFQGGPDHAQKICGGVSIHSRQRIRVDLIQVPGGGFGSHQTWRIAPLLS